MPARRRLPDPRSWGPLERTDRAEGLGNARVRRSAVSDAPVAARTDEEVARGRRSQRRRAIEFAPFNHVAAADARPGIWATSDEPLEDFSAPGVDHQSLAARGASVDVDQIDSVVAAKRPNQNKTLRPQPLR